MGDDYKEMARILVLQAEAIKGMAAIAEYMAEKNGRPRLVRIGVGDFFCKLGDLRFCWEQHGLTAPQIAERINKELQ